MGSAPLTETVMKSTLVQPYLFFGGRCKEALDFYAIAIGAQVDMLMLYKDSPEAPPPGGSPALLLAVNAAVDRRNSATDDETRAVAPLLIAGHRLK